MKEKMGIYVDDDTNGHGHDHGPGHGHGQVIVHGGEEHGHVPGYIIELPKIPETIEVGYGGHKHEHPAGFLFEMISDLPDHADGIWFSDSHLSSGVLILMSLATLGIIIFKLLKFHKKKKRRHRGKGGHSLHHQSHVSAAPVVHNYISFDPHQSNLGYSSSKSKVRPHRKRRRKTKHHQNYNQGWEREENELSGYEIQDLVNFLKQQRYAQAHEDSDDYY